VAKGIITTLLLLCITDGAEISYTSNLRRRLLVAIVLRRVIDHLALGLGVFDAAELFFTPDIPHTEVCTVKIILRYLLIVVQYGKFIVLARFQTLLDLLMLAFLFRRFTSTSLGKVLFLNALGQTLSCLLRC